MNANLDKDKGRGKNNYSSNFSQRTQSWQRRNEHFALSRVMISLRRCSLRVRCEKLLRGEKHLNLQMNLEI